MKKTIAILLMLILMLVGVISQVLSQGIEIECSEDLIIQDGIDIQFPNIDPRTSHTVTTIGLDSFDAVMAVFNQQQNGGCSDESVEASGYVLDFPTTLFGEENIHNAQMTFQNSNMMRVVVGEYENLAGEFVLMVEGLSYDGTPDLVNVTVTADMIQSGLPVTAYVIERSEGLNLSLALVDDNGVPLRDNVSESVECDDAGDNDSCWGAHTSLLESYVDISGTIEMSPTEISPMLSIPLTPDDEQTIIPFQISASPDADADVTGDYVFLLHVGVGELFLSDGIASVATTPSEPTTLSCNDEIWLDDAIEINLPRLESEYTVSLLGQEAASPIMAVMDSLGAVPVTCPYSTVT